MPATSLHLYSGWGFPRGCLDDLATLLREQLPTQLHEALDDLPEPEDLDGVLLAGWSLGALRVLEAACLGATPAGIILLAGTARFCSCDDYACGTEERAIRSMIVGLPRDPVRTMRTFLAEVAAPAPDAPAFVDRHTGAALALGERDLKRGLALLRDTDLRDGVRACATPVLLLHGSEDRIVPVAAGEWIHDALPTSQLIVRAGAGHDLPLRDPKWVADHMLEFAQSIP